MKRILFSVGILGMLAMVGPASAAIVLDFGGDAAGPTGNCTITSTSASCTSVVIAQLTVTGDGTYDGSYLVTVGQTALQAESYPSTRRPTRLPSRARSTARRPQQPGRPREPAPAVLQRIRRIRPSCPAGRRWCREQERSLA